MMNTFTLFHRQRGQGLVEAVIVLPVFGLFLLGIFQGILLYRAKTTLDY
ncbi:TadE/TadG family type IV pilus assembly protein, partial [Halothiobacillus neapolitanus]